MKPEELFFEADAALIDRLGRELVGRQETALIELVKNSYDADACHVDVILANNALTVQDDGTGMSRDELVSGFLRLASTMKVNSPTSSIFGRQRAGRKGIGRFATQRLGRKLRLQTRVDNVSPGLELAVDWEKFKAGRDLDRVPVSLVEIGTGKRGTTIEITGLRDEWTDAQIRRAWRGLLALQQPFPVAAVEDSPSSDPGFEVSFFRKREQFSDPTLVADFKSEILSHLHAMIEFRVDSDGRAEWRLSQNRFGPDRNWTKIHHDHRDDKDPPPYSALKNVAMKAHYFILISELLPGLIFSRVRDTLREEGGIRLYRNGFRVVPYGEPGNDWLHLDQIYAQRGTVLAPIANRNFFGVIEVNDPEGEQFEEHTSREGLIETESFQQLTDLTTAVLRTAIIKISEDRGRKKSAGGSSQRKATETLDKLKEAARAARAEEQSKGNGEEKAGPHRQGGQEERPSATGEQEASTEKRGSALAFELIDFIERQQAELADEAALLRLLATLGLTMSEFSHETGMTFEALRMDFDTIFEVAVKAREDDTDFIEQAARARAMLARLDALTAYLNELASARSIRELAPVSVSKALQDFESGIRRLAERSSIQLEFHTPAFDPLYTRPMHSAEVSSVLLNFYSNSLKALKRTSSDRRIRIEAERLNENELAIRFSDTGDGIPEENREKIFDLFYTTRVAALSKATDADQVSGTGLGLWIVQQIISKAGGDVFVAEPPNGYSTCLEVRLPAEEEEEGDGDDAMAVD